MSEETQETPETPETINPDFSKDIEDTSLGTMWSAIIEYGRDATKTALLINAGAVIAILAFYGNMMTRPANISTWEETLNVIPDVMLGYTAGVILAGVSMALTYSGQIQYYYANYRGRELKTYYHVNQPHEEKYYKKLTQKGNGYRQWAIATLGASYFFFVFCSCVIYCSLI